MNKTWENNILEACRHPKLHFPIHVYISYDRLIISRMISVILG